MSFDKLLNLDINATRIGLLGKKLDYSLSPKIHNYFFEQTNTRGHYHILEASDELRASELINELIKLEFTGINITSPYKSSCIKHADRLSAMVELSNASNTLVFGEQVLAENTDIYGFDKFLKNNKLDRYDTATILGAGGAARSVAVALLKNNIEVSMVNRTAKRFEEIPQDLVNQINLELVGDRNSHSDIFIDATTLGFQGISSYKLIPIGSTKAVVDLSYSKHLTPLISDVSKHGDISLYDGKEMLVYQAEKAFNLWLDRDLDISFNDLWNEIK